MEFRYFDESGNILEDLFSEIAEKWSDEFNTKRDDDSCSDYEIKFDRRKHKKMIKKRKKEHLIFSN